VSPASKVAHGAGFLCLAKINPHPRDRRIVFFKEDHSYYLDGVLRLPISVTGVWNKYFEPFVPEATVAEYFDTWSVDETKIYHDRIMEARAAGISDDDTKRTIIDGWRLLGLDASRRGTYMHRQIELALNKEPFDGYSVEMQQFDIFFTRSPSVKELGPVSHGVVRVRYRLHGCRPDRCPFSQERHWRVSYD
jgi:hypothetical protein